MKKLLNVKNLIVALVLVAGLTGIASFVSASQPIATIQYAGKDPIKISKETNDIPNTSIWYQDFENQNVEIDIFDYPTEQIELSVLKPDGNSVVLNKIDENTSSVPDAPYYEVISDTDSGKEKVQLNMTNLLNGDGVYKIQAKQVGSDNIDFEIDIIVDNTPPVVEVTLGKEIISDKDKLKPKYSVNELTVRVKDVNFDPQKNKGNYSISGTLKEENGVGWKLDSDGYMVATFVLDQGENTLDVTVIDEAGNKFVLQGNSNPIFIVDTEGPNIDINITNEEKMITSNLEIKISDNFSNINYDKTSVMVNGKKCLLNKDNKVDLSSFEGEQISIDVQAYDEHDNYSELKINSLTLDATAPIIDKITFNQHALGERYTYMNHIAVSITFNEENWAENGLDIELIKEKIQQSVAQVEWLHDEKNKVHTATFNIEQDGEYTLDFNIEDLAGNNTQSDTLSFMIDTKAPEIIIEDKEGNTIENGDVYHALELVSKINDENLNSATETYTLFKVGKEAPIESGKFENHQLTLNFDDTYEEGEYTLKIHAEDKAGRISKKEITFSIDRTTPSLQNYKYSDFIVEEIETETQLTKLYFNTTTVIELPIIDEHLDLENSILLINNKGYSFVDNKEYSFGSLTFENNSLKIEFNQAGEYTIDLDKVLDSAGNETEKEKFPEPLKIVVDTNNPIINTQVDEENLEDIEKNYGFINHDLTIDISIDDLTSTEFTCGYTAESQPSKEIKECSLTQEDDKFKLDLAVADHEVDTFNIKLIAKDIVGYETTKEFSITIDKVKPVVDYAVNEEEQISENDGMYYFDKGTAVDVFIKEHHFDETSPIVTYKYGKTKGSSLQEFVKDKDDLVWESVTDKENTYKATIELENDGYYYFDNVYVVDKASNKADTTQPSLNLAIDTKEPEFVYEDVVKLSNKDQELTIEVKDITYKELTYTVTKTNYVTKETEILVDNVTTSASKLVLDEHFKTDGTYNVNVTAVDWAGNSSEIAKEGITFTIDKVAPVVSKYELNAEIRKDQGVKYYSSGQEIKIYIDEFYFDEFDKQPTEVKEVVVDLIYKSSINGEEKERKYNLAWEKAQNRDDQYVATIKVEEDGYYELKDVKVIDQVGNEATSKPEAEKFVIDTVKPIIHVSDVKNEFYYKKGDKVTINVSIDETNFNPNLSTYTIYRKESLNSEEKVYSSGNITSQTDFKLPTLTENGEYRVVLTAKDMSDNQVEKDTELHFYIDHNDPKVSIKPVTANTANGSQQNVSEVVIGLSATDDWKLANTKYTVKRNNEVINVPKQGEWDDFKLSFKDEGYYQVEIETGDQAGTKTVKETLEFTIDRTSPAQLSIVGNANHHNSTTSVKDGESYSAPRVNLQFTAQDMYSFNKIKVDVTKNGKAYASQTFDVKEAREDFTNTFSKNANYSLSEEGEYEVTFTVYDQAGNQSDQKLSFEIDRTTPIITSNIEDGKYYNEDFLPEFTLDQPERDEFTFINIDGKNYKNSIPFLINDKVYTISALATDKAQNTIDYNATITIDKTSPTIGISNLITGFFKDTLSPSIFYNDTNLDSSKVSIKLNNVELGAGVGDENGYTKEININKDGNYTLEVSIGDLATNVSKQTIDFVLDNEKPIIKIKNKISLHNQPWIPELEVLEEHGYDVVMATLNGEEYDITQPITTEGKNVLFLQVADKSGNTESITVEFILDLTPPKVIVENSETNQLVKEGEHYLTSLDLKIYLDYIEGESQEYEEAINTILLNDEPQNLNVTMENGRKVYHLPLNEFKDYTLTVKATDSAGNETVETITFTLGDKDIFTKIYENKPVFYSLITITGLAVLGSGVYGVIVLKSKSKNKEDSSEE